MEDDQVNTAPVLTVDSGRTVDREIEVHLENMNRAIEEINTLSQTFLKARDEFIKKYEAGHCKLAALYKANKKIIDKARPFYIARDQTYKAKSEHRKWIARYKDACEELEKAKQIAHKAEEILLSSAASGSGGTTDPGLLSDLNRANDRVLQLMQCRDEAEKQKTNTMKVLSRYDEHLANTTQQLTKYVLKASIYYETRDKLQRQLDADYYNLWQLHQRVAEAKQRHKDMFSQFSAISVEFAQLKCADDVQLPCDLSKFEEIEDISSLDSSFKEDGAPKHMTSQSLDIASLHSNTSIVDVNMSHVTKPGHPLALEDLQHLSLADNFDVQESETQESCLDYGVSFQMNV